jgi:hypothetical protein
MNKTNAVEISIHAVLPESIGGAVVSCACVTAVPRAKIPKTKWLVFNGLGECICPNAAGIIQLIKYFYEKIKIHA